MGPSRMTFAQGGCTGVLLLGFGASGPGCEGLGWSSSGSMIFKHWALLSVQGQFDLELRTLDASRAVFGAESRVSIAMRCVSRVQLPRQGGHGRHRHRTSSPASDGCTVVQRPRLCSLSRMKPTHLTSVEAIQQETQCESM